MSDHEQGTDAWRQDRCGHITASRIADVLTKPRKGQKESSVRKNYLAELLCERLTGKVREDGFQSWEMKRGTELEPFARSEYELKTSEFITNVGFIKHPKIERAGASPDGLVGKDGLIQIKCPKRATHLEWLTNRIVPVEHRPQMLWEMACTGRQWCDFVSYNPDFPDSLQLFIARYKRDDLEVLEVENEVIRFDLEIQEAIRDLETPELEDKLKESLAAVKA
jgi:putative phage-type endonuclease